MIVPKNGWSFSLKKNGSVRHLPNMLIAGLLTRFGICHQDQVSIPLEEWVSINYLSPIQKRQHIMSHQYKIFSKALLPFASHGRWEHASEVFLEINRGPLFRASKGQFMGSLLMKLTLQQWWWGRKPFQLGGVMEEDSVCDQIGIYSGWVIDSI